MVGGIFTIPQAAPSDTLSGINGNVTPSGAVDTRQVGEYTITYKATDRVGNISVETLIVKVVAADKGALKDLMEDAKKYLMD